MIKEKFLSRKKYFIKLNEIINQNTSIDLENDLDLQLKAERIFEILTQTLLNIYTHIIAHLDEIPPKSYSECLLKIGKIGMYFNPRNSKKR
ncbi:MAG: HepT-like ribonuclease domain-containing protein [Promethearchaeota archaeon]